MERADRSEGVDQDSGSGAGWRRRALQEARLYLVCDSRPGGRSLADVLPAAIAGGVDIVQLREKALSDTELLEAAALARELCARAGALFIVNDRPDVAEQVRADGVHVGQEDISAPAARSIIGQDLILGLSTHARLEIDAAAEAGVDYIGVGPVHETPTKPGRPAVGVELVAYAAERAAVPFFAIGGLNADNLGEVLQAGAERVCVLRAITESPHPGPAAAALAAILRQPSRRFQQPSRR